MPIKEDFTGISSKDEYWMWVRSSMYGAMWGAIPSTYYEYDAIQRTHPHSSILAIRCASSLGSD
jgi:hypothetical protein